MATFIQHHLPIQYVHRHKMALAQGHNLKHFSLFVDHEPVSSITLSILGCIARIDDMGTSPNFQKRGFATRLKPYIKQSIGLRGVFLRRHSMASRPTKS